MGRVIEEGTRLVVVVDQPVARIGTVNRGDRRCHKNWNRKWLKVRSLGSISATTLKRAFVGCAASVTQNISIVGKQPKFFRVDVSIEISQNGGCSVFVSISALGIVLENGEKLL